MNIFEKNVVKAVIRNWIRHFRTTTHTEAAKGRSKSSHEWLQRHLSDPYVKKAQELNYRARSAFKLLEMEEKMKILKPGIIVVECGAAPGAWTQVIVDKINCDGKSSKPKGKVIGVDLLPIDPIHGAILLPGCDFTSSDTQTKIHKLLMTLTEEKNLTDDDSPSSSQFKLVDVVLSDMAPNSSGIGSMDHDRIMSLVKKALEFAIKWGKPGGHFLTKIWDGSETPKLEKELSLLYSKVERLKPPASRNESAEIFLFARSKKE